jgi:uncharacterized protein (TIGR02145 family)
MKKAVAVLRSAVGAFALGGVVLLAACGGGGGKAAFVGSWVHYEGKSDIDNFELLKDGTGTLDGEKSVSWKIEKNRFVISSEQLVMSNNYDISNDELTLINDNGDTTLFVKKESAKAFYKTGTKEKEAGNFDNAVAGFTEAIRLDTNFAKAYTGRGEIYFEKKDYDKAIEDYTVAIRLDTNFAKAYNGRAEAHIKNKDYDKAVEDYTNVLRINPNDSVINRELARIKNYSKFIDSRDGKAYTMVKVGAQTWMAENLNYDAEQKSSCYDGDSTNCEKYGRLYGADYSSACPAGLRFPTKKDWKILTDYAGGKAAKLKSSTGWKGSGNGTDDFGFAALPGGGLFYDEGEGGPYGIGEAGYWWLPRSDFLQEFVEMRYNKGSIEFNGHCGDCGVGIAVSVRCIQK